MPEPALKTQERKCKDCGKPLGAGREDRQYCDDGCRTNYNNRVRREKKKNLTEQKTTTPTKSAQPELPEHVTRIQAILVNNRRLLSRVCDKEKPGRIRERDLLGKGFNAKYFTSETEGSDSHYRFCFEYGYKKEEDDQYLVIYRPREVE